jgi:hypothetical protein
MNWMCGTGALVVWIHFFREPSPFVRFTGSEMQYWNRFAERLACRLALFWHRVGGAPL